MKDTCLNVYQAQLNGRRQLTGSAWYSSGLRSSDRDLKQVPTLFQENYFMSQPHSASPTSHHPHGDFSDWFAWRTTRFLRLLADTFFAGRYGHRAVVLETVAAVPGMVGGALQHLRSLRSLEDDGGWIKTLLDEAENERMHLMTFIHIAQPSRFERWMIILAQGIFYNLFFMLYLVSARTAHRLVGYFEEEAVVSYTEYLAGIDRGDYDNVPAPQMAIDYWKLAADARLRDVILVIRDDEAGHRDVNHDFANQLSR
jgi:ubiquinol oxidase